MQAQPEPMQSAPAAKPAAKIPSQEETALSIANAIFKKFDADNSGTIDKEEARDIFMDQLKKSGSTLIKFDQA